MKTLSDRDLGIDCDYVAKGETEEEVLDMASAHIRSEHPGEFDTVENMMRDEIRTE